MKLKQVDPNTKPTIESQNEPQQVGASFFFLIAC